MKNKFIRIVVISILMISLVGTVLALTSYEEEVYSKIPNLIPKLKYAFEKGFFLFTSWGQENDCSVYPDKEKWIAKYERIDCDDYCSYDKCAIDIWYDNTIYLGGAGGPPNNVNWNNWLKEEAGEGEYFVGTTYPWYYVQVYCCPESVPIIPEHSTKAYVCEGGDWDYKGRYDNDEYCSHDTSGYNKCWCADEDDDFYVDESGSVHCRSSARSSWCTSPISHSTYKCYSNDVYWYDSFGNREEKKEECGVAGCSNSVCNTPVCNTEADSNCDGIVDRSELGGYITKWINGQVTRTKLGEVIMAWVG